MMMDRDGHMLCVCIDTDPLVLLFCYNRNPAYKQMHVSTVCRPKLIIQENQSRICITELAVIIVMLQA